MLNPWRILVAGNADPLIERAPTAPAIKNVLMREFLAILALLFLEK